jgi:5-methylcytosine-specific restriction endonuclease McrA
MTTPSDVCPLTVDHDGKHCHWCGKRLSGRRTRWCSYFCSREAVRNHRWTQAKTAALALVAHFQCARCKGFFPRSKVEVNHIVPCKGQHSKWGCHHHADNLEVLCKPCHLETTAQQRAEGLL